MIFLAGRDRLTQRTLHRAVLERVSKQAGCENVRYAPSRRRPRSVHADVDTVVFLGRSYPVSDARLEVRFWFPAGVEHEYYRLNWIESDRELMIGFHQDASHSDLGPCHLQLDYQGSVIGRQSAAFIDAHPLAVLEKRLQQLPETLDALSWDGDQPSLPS